jgi:hypothetical protein
MELTVRRQRRVAMQSAGHEPGIQPGLHPAGARGRARRP